MSNIYCISNDEVMLDSLLVILEAEGHEIKNQTNMDNAETNLTDFKTHLLIIDPESLNLDNQIKELVIKLKSGSLKNSLKTLLLVDPKNESPYFSPEDKSKDGVNFFDGHLSKPFSTTSLLNETKDLLRKGTQKNDDFFV